MENKVSVSGSSLYIDGYAIHFRCPKVNLTRLNKFVFPNRYETCSRSTLFHTDTVPNHHYLAIILKQFIELLHTYFSLLLACERIGTKVINRCATHQSSQSKRIRIPDSGFRIPDSII